MAPVGAASDAGVGVPQPARVPSASGIRKRRTSQRVRDSERAGSLGQFHQLGEGRSRRPARSVSRAAEPGVQSQLGADQ